MTLSNPSKKASKEIKHEKLRKQASDQQAQYSPVVRTLAYHTGGPGSIPGLGGENY